MEKIAVVSGGFDPIHSGHIAMINNAAELVGDKVVVLLNSDSWLTRKKGRPFMPFGERKGILENLKNVADVIAFDDSDNSCIDGLTKVVDLYPDAQVFFCNGGDRTKENIPEMAVKGVNFLFGVGGDFKANSSSWILKEWNHIPEKRVWGQFTDLFQDNAVRVKELVIAPGQGISYQRHFKRSEIWFISKGECYIKHSDNNPEKYSVYHMGPDQVFTVKQGSWHQVYNTSESPCHIIEIQYGSETNEDDIERLEYYKA